MKISKRNIIAALLKPLLFLIPPKKGPVVLTFHNVHQKDYDWFENFIRNLVKDYEFLDPSNLDKEIHEGDVQTKILLTFDDGFFSNRVLAEEILSKYGIKAIFFITEDFIGLQDEEINPFVQKHFYLSSSTPPKDKVLSKPMSWIDINWLKENGHKIGAHTKTHPKLSKLKDEETLIEEIITSANRIEENTGVKINCFAFPFGTLHSINKQVVEIAKTRFDFIFSNLRGSVIESPGSQFIFRQNIIPSDPQWLTRMVIEGKLDWLYFKSRKLAKEQYSD